MQGSTSKQIPLRHFTEEGIDRRNVWKRINIFVSPIVSYVYHLNKYEGAIYICKKSWENLKLIREIGI